MIRLIGLLLILTPVNAFANFLPNFSKKTLRLHAQLDYLTSEANYSEEGGEFEDLAGNQSYENIMAKFGGFYAFKPHIGFSSYISLANATSQSLTDQRTNTELGEYTGAIYWQMVEKPFEIIPAAEIVIPFNRVDPQTDDVLTGEGALQLGIGSWLAKEWGSLIIYGYAGFNYRDEGRSSLLAYQAGAEFDFSGWYIGGEVKGYDSITDDEFTDTPIERTTVTNRVNGTSLTYYGVNPSRLDANAFVGFEFGKDNYAFMGLGKSLNGSATGDVLMAFAGIEMAISMVKNRPKRKSIIDKKEKRELKKFKVKKEKKSQRYFKESYQERRRRLKKKEERELKEVEKQFEYD